MQDANFTLYSYRRLISLCICTYVCMCTCCGFNYTYTHISKWRLTTFCFVCMILFFNQLLRKKQEEMQQKDLERRRMMEEQNKERVRQHLEARKHADARHANAVANFHELMRKREEDYNKRQEVL